MMVWCSDDPGGNLFETVFVPVDVGWKKKVKHDIFFL